MLFVAPLLATLGIHDLIFGAMAMFLTMSATLWQGCATRADQWWFVYATTLIDLFPMLPAVTIRSSVSKVHRLWAGTQHRGVLRISGDLVNSTIGIKADMLGGNNGSALNLALPDRSSFTIHFSNIRGLNSNRSSVEEYLGTSLPNLILLSETQLSRHAFTDPLQISCYNVHARFHYKGEVSAYWNTSTPIARLMDLDSPDFDVLWLKIYLFITTIFLCFCYCSPNSTDFVSFFEYLFSAMSSCYLLTHMLKFSTLGISMCTTLSSLIPLTLMWEEIFNEDAGKAFSLLATLEVLWLLVNKTIYVNIYEATVDSYPSAQFFVNAMFSFAVILALISIRFSMRHVERKNKGKLEVVQNAENDIVRDSFRQVEGKSKNEKPQEIKMETD
ncbi:hypothetical protein SK128_009924 [Halocaridina rubra]|uniref:Uncharacterized protein n=1 Tax=Halocaridina rubra TaxID=373956 RepID=A0AAN8ZUU6_HALRR